LPDRPASLTVPVSPARGRQLAGNKPGSRQGKRHSLGAGIQLAFCPSIPHIQAGARGGLEMGIFSWIVLGLITGWIASKIVNKTGSGIGVEVWVSTGAGDEAS